MLGAGSIEHRELIYYTVSKSTTFGPPLGSAGPRGPVHTRFFSQCDVPRRRIRGTVYIPHTPTRDLYYLFFRLLSSVLRFGPVPMSPTPLLQAITARPRERKAVDRSAYSLQTTVYYNLCTHACTWRGDRGAKRARFSAPDSGPGRDRTGPGTPPVAPFTRVPRPDLPASVGLAAPPLAGHRSVRGHMRRRGARRGRGAARGCRHALPCPPARRRSSLAPQTPCRKNAYSHTA